MDRFEHIELERLSHAYLVEGERNDGLSLLRALMKRFSISTQANPDYHEYAYDVFSIDDARDLREAQSFHSASESKKIFIILFNSIGHEAQNALLKTLEEPTAGTHFFFVIRTAEMLLPTVRSRMQVISRQLPVSSMQLSEREHAGERFLRGTVAERMKMIESMTKAKADDKPKAKEDARRFLAGLESLLYKDMGTNSKIAASLRDIIIAKHELSGRAPSLKLLLEHLALTMPIFQS